MALSAASAQTDQDSPGLYLFVTPIVSLDAREEETPTLRVFIKDSDTAAEALKQKGLNIIATDAESLTMSLPEPRFTLRGSPDSRSDSTFVVDFEEQSVIDMLAAQSWSGAEKPPPLGTLTHAVYEWIEEKTYARGFDFASKVATTRSGDCTEHAILLAATARAMGRPARVVFGLMLLEGEQTQAFMHAWTDVWDQGQWHLLDATLPETYVDDDAFVYVPLETLDNETPSYMMGFLASPVSHISRLEWRH